MAPLWSCVDVGVCGYRVAVCNISTTTPRRRFPPQKRERSKAGTQHDISKVSHTAVVVASAPEFVIENLTGASQTNWNRCLTIALATPTPQVQACPPCIASAALRGLRIAPSSTQDETEAVSGMLTVIPPAAAMQNRVAS